MAATADKVTQEAQLTGILKSEVPVFESLLSRFETRLRRFLSAFPFVEFSGVGMLASGRLADY
jgi:hypothetical protein